MSPPTVNSSTVINIDIQEEVVVEGGGGAAPGGEFSRQRQRHRRRRRRRRRRPSGAACSSETTTDGSSFRFSETEDDDNQSSTWHSQVGSYDECGGFSTDNEGISVFSQQKHKRASRGGSRGPGGGGEEEEEVVDLECGDLELMTKVKNRGEEEEEEGKRYCRICHLSLMGRDINSVSDQEESSCSTGAAVIELGCSCKGELGAAHKQCAETWFKIKGNTTCEICGATAVNVAGEQTIEGNNATEAAAVPPVFLSEARSFCHGRRVMNFLLACMVFAFVISWLFHFNVLP